MKVALVRRQLLTVVENGSPYSEALSPGSPV